MSSMVLGQAPAARALPLARGAREGGLVVVTDEYVWVGALPSQVQRTLVVNYGNSVPVECSGISGILVSW